MGDLDPKPPRSRLDRWRARRREAAEEAAKEKRAARYYRDTWLGKCPSCGSTNIRRVKRPVVDWGQAGCWGCFWGLIALPLAPIGLLAGGKTVLHSRCEHCRHEWPA
ncbi:MAG: hypothetical protein FJX75_12670 [Armatimonadetes bacterium]|nr:hypothetical protein [Armatimonadota bacterium]